MLLEKTIGCRKSAQDAKDWDTYSYRGKLRDQEKHGLTPIEAMSSVRPRLISNVIPVKIKFI